MWKIDKGLEDQEDVNWGDKISIADSCEKWKIQGILAKTCNNGIFFEKNVQLLNLFVTPKIKPKKRRKKNLL